VQQAEPMEVKADTQLGSHQRGVAQPAARASEVARKRGGSRLEKRTTFLTNTATKTAQHRLPRVGRRKDWDWTICTLLVDHSG